MCSLTISRGVMPSWWQKLKSTAGAAHHTYVTLATYLVRQLWVRSAFQQQRSAFHVIVFAGYVKGGLQRLSAATEAR